MKKQRLMAKRKVRKWARRRGRDKIPAVAAALTVTIVIARVRRRRRE